MENGIRLRQHTLWRLSGLLSAGAGNDVIADLIRGGTPASVGKVGAAELAGLVYLARYRERDRHPTDWGDVGTMLHVNAGVFPEDPDTYSHFCREYTEALRRVDLLGAWYQRDDYEIARRVAGIRKAAEQRAIEPYYHPRPWSRALAGKAPSGREPVRGECRGSIPPARKHLAGSRSPAGFGTPDPQSAF